MQVKIDSKTNLPNFTLEEKDLKDAREIAAIMEMPGWVVLDNYWNFAREAIIEAGKIGVSTKDKVTLSAEKWAILKGYDDSKSLAIRVVRRAEDYKKEQDDKEKEERDHGNRDLGGD